jgi:hypothetical protein
MILGMDVRLPSDCTDSTAIRAGEEADARNQPGRSDIRIAVIV